MCKHIGISANRTGEMGVNWTGEAVMSKSIASHAARAEVLGGKHASSGHNSNQCVKCRFVGINTSVQRGSESSRGGYIQAQPLALLQDILELFEVRLGWGKMATLCNQKRSLRAMSCCLPEDSGLRKSFLYFLGNADVSE